MIYYGGRKLARNAKFQHNIAFSAKLRQLGQTNHKDLGFENHYKIMYIISLPHQKNTFTLIYKIEPNSTGTRTTAAKVASFVFFKAVSCGLYTRTMTTSWCILTVTRHKKTSVPGLELLSWPDLKNLDITTSKKDRT